MQGVSCLGTEHTVQYKVSTHMGQGRGLVAMSFIPAALQLLGGMWHRSLAQSDSDSSRRALGALCVWVGGGGKRGDREQKVGPGGLSGAVPTMHVELMGAGSTFRHSSPSPHSCLTLCHPPSPANRTSVTLKGSSVTDRLSGSDW